MCMWIYVLNSIPGESGGLADGSFIRFIFDFLRSGRQQSKGIKVNLIKIRQVTHRASARNKSRRRFDYIQQYVGRGPAKQKLMSN